MNPSIEPFDEEKYKRLMDGLECSEIRLSNLERTHRIDAEFYQKNNLQISETLNKMPLQNVAHLFQVSDGNHLSIADYFSEKGVPYYRGQDMYCAFIEEAAPICISQDIFNMQTMMRSHLKKGDVLVSIVGTIGNSALVATDQNATCSCKLAILRSLDKDILPETLFVFIRTLYGQNQIQKLKRGAVQMGFILEDFSQLYIPLFSNTFQEKIKEVCDSSRQYSAQAKKMYEDAEELLINKLGFASFCPSKEQISIRSFKNVLIKNRIDAEYYQPKYDELLDLLCKLPTKKLGEIVEITKSIEPGSKYYGDEGIPFIRVSDVSKIGIEKPTIRIPDSIIPSPETLYPQKDTILFSKDGSIGVAYKVEEDIEAVTSGALLHFQIKNTDEILPDYLTLVLNSKIVQLQAERDSSGAIIQHWKPEDIEKVTIPILPYEMQLTISEMIKKSFSFRHKAEVLLKEAMKAVEIAVENGEDEAINFVDFTQ